MSIRQNRSRDSAGKHSGVRGVISVPFRVRPPSASSNGCPGTAFFRSAAMLSYGYFGGAAFAAEFEVPGVPA